MHPSLRTALRSLKGNKGRAFLSTLGVTIGVAAVVTIVSLGQMMTYSLTEKFNAMGSDLLMVTPGGQGGFGSPPNISAATAALTLNDAFAIAAKATVVQTVAPLANGSANLVWNERSFPVALLGTTDQYTTASPWPAASGRFLTRLDVESQNQVAVLGSSLAQQVFGGTSPIGQAIFLGGIPFRVVGVMKEKGIALAGGNLDSTVVVPVTTYLYSFSSTNSLGQILVLPKDAAAVKLATSEIQHILHFQHNLPPGAKDDFSVQNPALMLKAVQGVMNVLTYILGGIGGISLLVGGVGIMNIMLVSVTERTREIGIRRAVGATRANILSQFLLEAMALSLTGGTVGILLGTGLADLVALLGQKILGSHPPLVSGGAILLAFAFSALVGVIFGVYPAYKASRANLVDALRYE